KQCGSAHAAGAKHYSPELVVRQQTDHLLHQRRSRAAEEEHGRDLFGGGGDQENDSDHHWRNQYLRLLVAGYAPDRVPKDYRRRKFGSLSGEQRRLKSAQSHEQSVLRRLAGLVAGWKKDRVRFKSARARLPDF